VNFPAPIENSTTHHCGGVKEKMPQAEEYVTALLAEVLHETALYSVIAPSYARLTDLRERSEYRLKRAGNCFTPLHWRMRFPEDSQTLLRVNPKQRRPQPGGDLEGRPLQEQDLTHSLAQSAAAIMALWLVTFMLR
jgi:hypothetical protein